MISKAHKHMHIILKKISKMFNVELLTEVKEGSKRYDFYFPTNPPIVIEVDGDNHQLKKADGFFFKSDESLIKYKLNDLERERFKRLGKIILFRFSDKEFPSISEILDILGDQNIEILKKGIDKRNAYAKSIIKNREYSERRKEQIRKLSEKFKK
jgi:hypothetical protein